jgi:hypothetical protein
MTLLSEELLELSFKNNSTIAEVKKKLRLAAEDGLVSLELTNIPDEDITIVTSFLISQNIQYKYDIFTGSFKISWS